MALTISLRKQPRNNSRLKLIIYNTDAYETMKNCAEMCQDQIMEQSLLCLCCSPRSCAQTAILGTRKLYTTQMHTKHRLRVPRIAVCAHDRGLQQRHSSDCSIFDLGTSQHSSSLAIQYQVLLITVRDWIGCNNRPANEIQQSHFWHSPRKRINASRGKSA